MNARFALVRPTAPTYSAASCRAQRAGQSTDPIARPAQTVMAVESAAITLVLVFGAIAHFRDQPA
jgi:hypothetical protein